jgi:exopolyphosphatase/guanosine-5'-triphosphate,3'-diphosphate pyrophosphatase
MRWSNALEIFVPKIGLADGLIQHLYLEVANGNDSGVSPYADFRKA